MSKITIRVEEYNKLDLISRARLTVHNVDFDARTASLADRALARKNQLEALVYVNDSKALVAAGRLNVAYKALVGLAHEAENIAEIRNKTTLTKLQHIIVKLCFGYIDIFAELTKLIEGEREESNDL